jgi:hypothetical protein
MADRKDSHYPTSIPKGKNGAIKEQIMRGPVTQAHRYKLGEADGATNPYGTGDVSRVSTVQNHKKEW